MRIILWILIIGAAILVCIKKIKAFKAGRYCDCGCSECSLSCKRIKEFKGMEENNE